MSLALNEGAAGTITQTILRATDADNPPAQLTYAVTSGPTHGTLRRSGVVTTTFTQADIDAGLVSYLHDGSETTDDRFDFTVDDGQGTSTDATFNINVTPVNDEEVLRINLPLAVSEGATAAITPMVLQATDTDDAPAQLTYTVTTGPSNGTVRRSGVAATTFTQADIDAGRVSYEHDGTETTADRFNFTVDDGQGTSTGGALTVVIASIRVPGPQIATEDTPLVFSAGAGNPIVVSGIDTSSHPVFVTIVATNGTMTLGRTVDLTFGMGDGVMDSRMTFTGNRPQINAALDGVVFHPAPDHNGPASSQITVDDGANINSGGGSIQRATVDIEVLPVNDAPTAVGDTYTIRQFGTLAVSGPGVLNNDTDVEGAALRVLLDDGPFNGTLSLAADGAFVYTPERAFFGVDSFSYHVSDGTLDSQLTTVTVVVHPAAWLPGPPPAPSDAPTSPAVNSPVDGPDASPALTYETVVESTDPVAPIVEQTIDRRMASAKIAAVYDHDQTLEPVVDQAESPKLEDVQLGFPPQFAMAVWDSSPTFRSMGANRRAAATDRDVAPSLDTDLHWQHLDAFQGEIAANIGHHTFVLGSVTGVTAATSIGYATWTVRRRYLLFGVISSLPAWTLVDPLPVLASYLDSERPSADDDQEEKALQSLVSGSNP